MTKPGVCLVVGAGDATGGAVARRFAREGFVVCATPRTLDPLQPLLVQIRDAGGMAFGFGSDARMHEFVDVVFEAIWVDTLNMNDAQVVDGVLKSAHFDPVDLHQLANEQPTKNRLKEVTTQAVERGVFGAPTFFVGEQMFWGQDRIEQLKAALKV
jgi:2-hydroxychromene-2-carboxylate isomerase